MSFLTPLYLLGLAAIALPVVFHLIRRQPRGRKVFSTVMFLEPSPPRVTRRSRLDHWLLLLLRAAALCLLALAFCRPFLREVLGTDAPGSQGETIAVLVDTSASMRRDGLWKDAVRRIEAIMEQRQPLDRVALIAFDREVRPLVTFEEWSAVEPAARAGLVRERLEGVSPGWAATHLDQALVTAGEMLRGASVADSQAAAAGPKRIVLVTDFAEGSRLQGLAGGEWPRDVSVGVVRVGPALPTNAGVQLVAAADDTGGGRSGTPSDRVDGGADARQIRVRVTNAGDSAREQFELRWELSHARSAAGETATDVYCPAGQSRIVRIALPKDLPLPARLVLSGDDHAFDNAISVDRPAREPVHVLHYTDATAEDPEAMRFYLEHACTAAARHDIRVTNQPPDAPGPVPLVRDVHLVVVSAAPAEGRLPGLRRYVEQGGTLLIAAGSPETCAVFNGIFQQDALTAEEAEVAGYAMLGAIDFPHPLFAALAEPRFADFTGVRVWRHRRITFAETPETAVRVLARFDGGSPAIVEQPLGRGRVLLFAFGWHPADSQLALSTKFVPMLHALVGLAAGHEDAPRRLVVGDPLPVTDRVFDGDTRLTVSTPDDRTVTLAAGEKSFAGTVVPGIYRVAASDSEGERRFTVSLPADESRTAPLALDRFEAAGVRLARAESPEVTVTRAARERQLRTEELESRQKFWRWLIVVAVGVLVLETWLAGRLTRRPATATYV